MDITNNKFVNGLNTVAEKLNKNKFLQAYQGAASSTMGVILVGAIFCILAVTLSNLHVIETGSTVYNILYTPYNMTMGLLCIILAYAIAYNYAENLSLKAASAGWASLLCFLMVAAPITTVTMEDGNSFTGLPTSNLGATGMFVAMIVAFVTVKIQELCIKKNIVIKMPDVIPAALGAGFSAMLPLLFNVIFWYGLSVIVSLASNGSMTIPSLIMTILRYPLAGIDSWIGIIVIVILSCLFWFLGIHGTGVVSAIMFPLMVQDAAANASLLAAGKALVFTPTMAYKASTLLGGAGNILCLNLLGLRSKSEKIKTVSRAALIPSFFSIGEPAIFGYPIMYNPIMGMGFIVASVVPTIIACIIGPLGLMGYQITVIYAIIPFNLSTWVCSGFDIHALIFILAMVPVGMLCWYPFFKAYEKECITEEATEAEELKKAQESEA
jgi:PTS system cellobiose-specific IIC component